MEEVFNIRTERTYSGQCHPFRLEFHSNWEVVSADPLQKFFHFMRQRKPPNSTPTLRLGDCSTSWILIMPISVTIFNIINTIVRTGPTYPITDSVLWHPSWPDSWSIINCKKLMHSPNIPNLGSWIKKRRNSLIPPHIHMRIFNFKPLLLI